MDKNSHLYNLCKASLTVSEISLTLRPRLKPQNKKNQTDNGTLKVSDDLTAVKSYQQKDQIYFVNTTLAT